MRINPWLVAALLLCLQVGPGGTIATAAAGPPVSSSTLARTSVVIADDDDDQDDDDDDSSHCFLSAMGMLGGLTGALWLSGRPREDGPVHRPRRPQGTA